MRVEIGQPCLTPSQYASVLVSRIEGGTQSEDVREEGADEDIRAEKCRLHNDARGKCGGEVHVRLWCGNLTERDHLENLGVDGRIMLNVSSRSGMGHGLVRSDSG